MKHSKIAIIGAGTVGSTIAYALLLKNIGSEIMLVDIDEQRCKGEILDLSDALSFSGASKVFGGSPQDAGKADIIIISAGKHQKSGQTRDELISTNSTVISSVMKAIQPINSNAIVLIVTNPLDTLTLLAQDLSGLPKNQVFGSGTLLDTQRLRGFISKKVGVAEQSIHAYILGEHGETQFPAWSCARIGGKPLTGFSELTKSNLDAIAEETRKKAYNIIACKGATFWGIGACVSSICETILFDQKKVMPVSCYIKEHDIYLSMPCVLGKNGIEKTISIPLNTEEQKQLEHSVAVLKKAMAHLS